MRALELSLMLESLRTLESNIFFSLDDTPSAKSILFTSAGPEEGKSTVIANLAVTLSHFGKKVLLVDADLRRPVLHKIFKISNETGLSDFLSGDEKELKIDKVVKPNLSLLPSGSVSLSPSKLINSDEMKKLIKQLLDRAAGSYDIVLFDSPPVLAIVDTALLASLVDRVVFVINTGKVTKFEVKRAKKILDKADAKIIGTVLNNFNDSDYGTAYHPYSPVYLKQNV